jgi:uncharacterized protein
MTRPAPRSLLAALALAFLLLPLGAPGLRTRAVAQPPPASEEEDALAAYVRAHYTKREVRIPMRDGVRLFTSIYSPNDAGVGAATYPILLIRTPYDVGPYGADQYRESLGPSDDYAHEKFIFVYQDVRGKYMSEGEFVNLRPQIPDQVPAGVEEGVDESTDAWDTIDWLVENLPGNNGRVGLWGVSYPGFYASAGAIDSHPALKAVSPQAPIADWFFDDFHRHGAFILPMAFNFFSGFGRPRPEPTTEDGERFDHGTSDGYAFFLEMGPLSNADERFLHGEIPFWNDIAAHPNYDEYWQSRNILPHLDGIGAAVLVVGGWYDTEDLYGPLATYRAIERQNPEIENSLVMGPWPHGGWQRGDGDTLGEADFGFPTSEYYQRQIELPFFRHHLKEPRGQGGELHLAEATVFETGANRWRRFNAWPPAGLEEASLHLREGSGSPSGAGSISFDPPPAEAAGEPFDEFVSDPSRPVPYTTELTTRWARDYMTEDQRFAARRPDVLVYRSEPLEEDLTIAGPITADLWVSTTGRDADWIVKVIDEHPVDEPRYVEHRTDPANDLRGAQRLVRAEVFRGRFRESYEHPKPFEPGEVTRVSYELRDVLHTFRRGHRIMIQVQSTWFPFVDRNPQSWVENIFEAEEEDFIPATHRVYRSPEHPSRVRVGVLEQ